MWAVAFAETRSCFCECPAGCQRAVATRVASQDAQTRGACGGALRPARARLIRDPAGRAEHTVLSEKMKVLLHHPSHQQSKHGAHGPSQTAATCSVVGLAAINAQSSLVVVAVGQAELELFCDRQADSASSTEAESSSQKAGKHSCLALCCRSVSRTCLGSQAVKLDEPAPIRLKSIFECSLCVRPCVFAGLRAIVVSSWVDLDFEALFPPLSAVKHAVSLALAVGNRLSKSAERDRWPFWRYSPECAPCV